jgi:oligopeptide/dipeptide ABC transporter ATP-binding protein
MKHFETLLLSIKNVRKWYEMPSGFRRKENVKAVDGISLDIRQGEVHAIVGESGSGKSTLARLIVGLEEPDSGSMTYEGIELCQARKNKERKRRFGKEVQMVFQNPYSSLNPRKSVRKTLLKPFKVHGEMYSEGTLEDLLTRVELMPSSFYLDKFPHQLSGGQRQRISIARSLALGPKLVVLDEPTSALDVTTKTQILDLLRKLQREENLTLIFIAHELPFLKFVSDRVSVMYNGRIVEEGRSREIFENAYHPYSIGLLGSILEIDPQRAREKGIFSVEGETPSSITPPSGCRFHPRCPLMEDTCKMETPQMTSVSKDHLVACPVSVSRFTDTKLDRSTIYKT